MAKGPAHIKDLINMTIISNYRRDSFITLIKTLCVWPRVMNTN